MKPVITLSLLATLLFAAGCGLSEQQKTTMLQEQKAKDDSIRLADIRQIKNTQALKSTLSDSLVVYTGLLSKEENQLIQVRASLYTENDQLGQIKGFHLGRLPQQREMEIRNQVVVIQSLALQQSNIQAAIQQTSIQITRTKGDLSRLKY